MLLALLLLANGCRSAQPAQELITLVNGPATLVYAPTRGRVVYYGINAGPNVLHLTPNLFRPVRPDHYDFRGGAYTWLAPQSAWTDEHGKQREWPPAPAIDTGPMQPLHVTGHELTVIGPPSPAGICERQHWRLLEDGSLQVQIALLAETSGDRQASAWSTSTTPPGSIIAVPRGPIRFDPAAFEQAWRAASRIEGDWIFVDTARVTASGKAFVDAPPIVAAWHDRQWLVRVGEDPDAPRHPHDTPVEIYISPQIIELELIGPYRPVKPGAGHAWSQRWFIIPSDEPSPPPVSPK